VAGKSKVKTPADCCDCWGPSSLWMTPSSLSSHGGRVKQAPSDLFYENKDLIHGGCSLHDLITSQRLTNIQSMVTQNPLSSPQTSSLRTTFLSADMLTESPHFFVISIFYWLPISKSTSIPSSLPLLYFCTSSDLDGRTVPFFH
jgi:hypothetical protein